MIWIRADANSEIGTGHVMRCLAVAAALQECGREVGFLLADEEAAPLLEARGQRYYILHTPFRRMEEELPLLRRLAGEQQPEACLIDSYFVTPNYLSRIGACCRTVYMDDLFRFPYPADLVVNYNIYGDQLPYRDNPGKKHTRFLLGCDYVPLRREFRRREEPGIARKAEKVLITTGGSDPHDLAGQILEAALAHDSGRELTYHVVSGAYNGNLPRLKQLAGSHPNIHIHENVTDMAGLMEACDMAVTAGGSTMYELCAMGVPIICFSFVDNQEKIVETFVQKGLVYYGGRYSPDTGELPGQVIDCLCRLAEDRDARAGYSRRGRELVDGRGAERIARAILEPG